MNSVKCEVVNGNCKVRMTIGYDGYLESANVSFYDFSSIDLYY